MAEQLEADAGSYVRAASLNVAPPAVAPDPLVAGDTPVEQLLRALGAAVNASDPEDNAESADGHARRDAWTTEAAGTFSGQDMASATQVISSIAGALGGVATGLLQPLGSLPQLLAQGAQQAIHAATSLVGQRSPIDQTPAFEGAPDPAPDGIDLTDAGDTAVSPPVAVSPVLPAVPPPAATATHPSALTTAPVAHVAVAPPVPAPAPSMAGMPMVPPAGLPATGIEPAKAAGTKRIAVGPVKSGKPVVSRTIRTEAAAE